MNPQELTGWEKFLIFYFIPMIICLASNIIHFFIKREMEDDMISIAPFVPGMNFCMAICVAMFAAIVIPHFLFVVLPCLAMKREFGSKSNVKEASQ